MFSLVRKNMQKRYQIVTDNHSDGGFDEKSDHYHMNDAVNAAKKYMNEGYEGVGIYDIISGKWKHFYGNFRTEELFR